MSLEEHTIFQNLDIRYTVCVICKLTKKGYKWVDVYGRLVEQEVKLENCFARPETMVISIKIFSKVGLCLSNIVIIARAQVELLFE